ncbi:MAG: LDCC motif putative metal-binding protein [Bacillota bacterium]
MVKFWARLKAAVQNYLEKMAKENEKAFGNGKLDCCSLNKPDSDK